MPRPGKPDHRYYVDIVILMDHTHHKWLIAKAIQSFPRAKWIFNPNFYKPGGTNLVVRTFFPTTTAPRDCFLPTDATVPIRELQSDDEVIAIVNHKWPKLNKTILPSKVGIWCTRGATHDIRISTR